MRRNHHHHRISPRPNTEGLLMHRACLQLNTMKLAWIQNEAEAKLEPKWSRARSSQYLRLLSALSIWHGDMAEVAGIARWTKTPSLRRGGIRSDAVFSNQINWLLLIILEPVLQCGWKTKGAEHWTEKNDRWFWKPRRGWLELGSEREGYKMYCFGIISSSVEKD